MVKRSKELNTLFDNIHEGWLETQRGSLFSEGDLRFELLEKACIAYLIYRDYKIVKPIQNICSVNVKKLDDLIRLFYIYSDYYHSELISTYRNMVKDRALAKLFVKSRMEASNINRKEALNECAQIIETVFKHEEEFGFTIPLTFSVFGQKKLGWITEKAIQIINIKKQNSEDERRKELIDTYEKVYDAELGGFGDLDKILKGI